MSTCGCSGLLGLISKDSYFSHIFLDEASQALEPEALIPLTLSKPETSLVRRSCREHEYQIVCIRYLIVRKLGSGTCLVNARVYPYVQVLAGDPKQLGAITRSRLAQHLGLATSLQENLMKLPVYEGQGRLKTITRLVRNYR